MSSLFLLLRTVHDTVHDLRMKRDFSEPKIFTGGVDNKMDNSGRLGNLSLNHDIENIDLMNPEFYSGTMTEEYLWENFPRSLSKGYYMNPYKVFSKFFKVHSLDELKDELRYFLIVALSDFEIDDVDTLKYKNLLDNLIDACCLICERELNCKDEI